MKVLYSHHRTTIPELVQWVGSVAKQLYAEALNSGAMISGPQYWVYHGMDGKDETVFDLEIALPIQGAVHSTKFKVKELQPLRSLSHWHEGPWENMPATYGAMLQHIELHKIPMVDECREIYYNVDFDNPENNRVEIQLGIM